MKPLFSELRSPWENDHNELCNGKMQDESPFRGCRLIADGVIPCTKGSDTRHTDDKNGGVFGQKWHCIEPATVHIACKHYRANVLQGC